MTGRTTLSIEYYKNIHTRYWDIARESKDLEKKRDFCVTKFVCVKSNYN